MPTPTGSFIEPLPDLPDFTPGSETEFSDLVTDFYAQPEFTDTLLDDAMQAMVDDWDASYGLLDSAGADVNDAAASAAVAAASSPDTLQDDFDSAAPAVDSAVQAFTDFVSPPSAPPPVTPDSSGEIAGIQASGDAISKMSVSTSSADTGSSAGETGGGAPTTPPPPPSGDIAIQPDLSVLWQTQNCLTARVYVAVDDGPWTLFAEAPSGQVAAPWIMDGHKFVFRLVDFSTGADGVELRRATEDLRPGSNDTTAQNSLPPPPPAKIITIPSAVPLATALLTQPAPQPAAPTTLSTVLGKYTLASPPAGTTLKAVAKDPNSLAGLTDSQIAEVKSGSALGAAILVQQQQRNDWFASTAQYYIEQGDYQGLARLLGRPITTAEIQSGVIDVSDRDPTGQTLMQAQQAASAARAAAGVGILVDINGNPLPDDQQPSKIPPVTVTLPSGETATFATPTEAAAAVAQNTSTPYIPTQAEFGQKPQ